MKGKKTAPESLAGTGKAGSTRAALQKKKTIGQATTSTTPTSTTTTSSCNDKTNSNNQQHPHKDQMALLAKKVRQMESALKEKDKAYDKMCREVITMKKHMVSHEGDDPAQKESDVAARNLKDRPKGTTTRSTASTHSTTAPTRTTPPHVLVPMDDPPKGEKQRMRTEIKKRVREYIKAKIFWGLKFLDHRTEKRVYKQVLQNSGITNPGCNYFTDREFQDIIQNDIRSAFTTIRHRCQSLARKNYLRKTQ